MKSSDIVKPDVPINVNRNTFYILWFYYIFPDQKEELSKLSNESNISNVLLSLNASLDLNHILGSQILSFSHYNRKFSIIEYICNHLFISPIQKNSFLDIFCTIQKIYLWLNRTVYLRKLKKANVAVDTDLYFNTLSIRKSNVFPLYQNNTLFYFSVSDLLNIVHPFQY